MQLDYIEKKKKKFTRAHWNFDCALYSVDKLLVKRKYKQQQYDVKKIKKKNSGEKSFRGFWREYKTTRFENPSGDFTDNYAFAGRDGVAGLLLFNANVSPVHASTLNAQKSHLREIVNDRMAN